MIFSIKNQSIKTKIVLAILASTIFFSITTYFISSKFIINGYIELEEEVLQTDVTRVETTFKESFNNLKIKMSDWSTWDDTYFFVDNMNKGYINSNLNNSTLTNMEIHGMVFMNNTGKIVYSYFQDSKNQPVKSDEFIEYINSNIDTFKFKKTTDFLSGVVHLRTNDLVVLAGPILRNDGTGPIAGTLIFVDFIDSDFVSRISGLTKIKTDLYQLDSPSLPPDVVEAGVALSKGAKYFLKDLSEDIDAGYFNIYDIKNNPISTFRVTISRDIYKQGLKTSGVFIWIIIFMIISFGVVNIFFTNKVVLKRLLKLSGDITGINIINGEHKRLIEEPNSDEVTDIYKKVNSVLDKISEAEDLEKKSVDKFKEQMKEVARLNDLMIGREVKMIELKKEINDLKSKNKEIV